MPNIFIATMPASGHVNPMLAIARKLVERGHTVHWYCARSFAPKIETVGATLVEMRSIPQRGRGNGDKPIARILRWLGFGGTMVDWTNTFIDPIENQAEGAHHDPPTEAANLVEQLATTQKPVMAMQIQSTELALGDQMSVKALA